MGNGTGAITSYFDVAQLVLYVFWAFFAALVWYLIRENHREGYPMDNDAGILMEGWPRIKDAKIYRMNDGREVAVPRGEDPFEKPNADPTHRYAGSPIEPNGDPLLAGVGPGSWSAVRPDIPDVNDEGEPRIVPLALALGCSVSENDPDPRGMPVVDSYGDVAGTVRELWIDRCDIMFRFLDVELAGNGRRVLVPLAFARVTATEVVVDALLANQYGGVPATRSIDRITMLEEERICAYFGAGTLYAEPKRSEPLI